MKENDLMAKLMKSKQIMDTVENSKFVRNDDGSMIKVGSRQPQQYQQHPMQQYQQPYPMQEQYNNEFEYRDPNAPSGSTKLPKEILEAMLNNPIPTFDDVRKANDPFEQAALMMEQQRKSHMVGESFNRPMNINTNTNSDMITISKAELKAMIYESMLEILPKITANIEETAIRKTVQLIIKENKEKKGRL